MCRAVLESEAGQQTAKGVNDGIVYLMIIPYVLVAGVAFVVYKQLKKPSKKLQTTVYVSFLFFSVFVAGELY